MRVCFVLYVYIIQAHRTRYVSHPSQSKKHLPRSTKQQQQKKKKLKTRSSKTAFSDHLKTKNKKTCPNVTPHKPAASLHVHQDHHAPVCVWGCVCLWVCVCVYPCVSLMPCLRKWRWEVRGRGDPPGDPNHTQAMHYRRNQRGGGSARGHMGSEVKGCRKMEEDKRGEAG